MAKYDPLRNYLQNYEDNELSLAFKEIERIIGSDLPPSAYGYRQWWENNAQHVQALAWLNAGWKVDTADLGGRKVTLRRA